MNALCKQFRNLMEDDEIHIAPGAFDGMTSRLVEQAGFELVYASGGAISRSCGFPDIGLLSLSEVLTRISHMVEVTGIPIVADADTGFGNSVNVARAIREFEKTGVVAVHIEDQEFPKRCGHLAGKNLIDEREMQTKIQVAKESSINSDFSIIARTDAIAVEGFDRALERAVLYEEAGADIIFVEAPETEEQMEEIGKAIRQPKLINMFHGGKTPLVEIGKLKEWGYKLVIIPSDLQRVAIKACQDALEVIRKNGDSGSIAKSMASFSEREEIVRTTDYLEIDNK